MLDSNSDGTFTAHLSVRSQSTNAPLKNSYTGRDEPKIVVGDEAGYPYIAIYSDPERDLSASLFAESFIRALLDRADVSESLGKIKKRNGRIRPYKATDIKFYILKTGDNSKRLNIVCAEIDKVCGRARFTSPDTIPRNILEHIDLFYINQHLCDQRHDA